MELDKRIKDIYTIQTILQHDVNCIGCKGYFFDVFVKTKDLAQSDYGTLVDINIVDNDDHCFKARDENGREFIGYYRFFIPEDALNPVEKKYRPYSLAEWIDQHEIGEVIHFRSSYDLEYHVMYTGYTVDKDADIQDIRTQGQIMLASTGYLLQELFENCKICINGEWKPFGVEAEEND